MQHVLVESAADDLDFSPLHQRMRWYIARGILPGCSTLTLRGLDVVDFRCYGAMDIESARPLEPDTIFRLQSSSKLITSVAALMLVEAGRLRLDEPVATHLPEFAELRVLRPNATRPDDSEPARSPITVQQLMTHTSGLSYGFLDPSSLIDRIYADARVFENVFYRRGTLEELVHALARLPLAFQPGTAWRYSLATDVLSRAIEVASGQRFEEFLEQRIFQPLGMHDTSFYIPEDKRHRLATLYISKDGRHMPVDVPSLYFNPQALPSGGGGLASTMSDYATLVRMLIAGGTWNNVRILRPETIALMRAPQLAVGMPIASPQWSMPNTSFGLGVAVKLAAQDGEPLSAAGEYHWGGLAGTHWWIAPRANLAGICMSQRLESFLHPYSHDFKQLAYTIAAPRR